MTTLITFQNLDLNSQLAIQWNGSATFHVGTFRGGNLSHVAEFQAHDIFTVYGKDTQGGACTFEEAKQHAEDHLRNPDGEVEEEEMVQEVTENWNYLGYHIYKVTGSKTQYDMMPDQWEICQDGEVYSLDERFRTPLDAKKWIDAKLSLEAKEMTISTGKTAVLAVIEDLEKGGK
jgi:hypothetical protein